MPIPAPCTPLFPSCPLTLPFLLSPLLYARARCGRRRLGQVRLSLGFNIGENTGFYLIVRYPALRGKGVVWGWLRVGGEGGEERKRKRELGCTRMCIRIGFRSSIFSECEGVLWREWIALIPIVSATWRESPICNSSENSEFVFISQSTVRSRQTIKVVSKRVLIFLIGLDILFHFFVDLKGIMTIYIYTIYFWLRNSFKYKQKSNQFKYYNYISLYINWLLKITWFIF